jgi:hypothetical protein
MFVALMRPESEGAKAVLSLSIDSFKTVLGAVIGALSEIRAE